MAERLTAISEAQALEQFRGRDLVPFVGTYTIDQAVVGANCWQLETKAGRIAFTTRQQYGMTWVDAAAGESTRPMLADLVAAVEQIAAAGDTADVVFQTARPGLVRAAQKLGFEVKGWILGKKVSRESAA